MEYARLQGFPDDHCSAVSVYNQYALYGNAVPPVFAGWVLDKILENRVTSLENASECVSLFSGDTILREYSEIIEGGFAF